MFLDLGFLNIFFFLCVFILIDHHYIKLLFSSVQFTGINCIQNITTVYSQNFLIIPNKISEPNK